MTVVEVYNGSCGFLTRILVSRRPDDLMLLSLTTDCESACRWGQMIEVTDWRSCFGKDALKSTFWRSAFEVLQHRSCPVIIGVLRAIETEMGLAPPADTRIHFPLSE